MMSMDQVQVSIDEAKERLSSLVEEVIKGKEIFITKDNKPVIKLVLVSENKIAPKAGSAKGMLTIADDFDEPLEEFREYM